MLGKSSLNNSPRHVIVSSLSGAEQIFVGSFFASPELIKQIWWNWHVILAISE
jgi:hypothetical protein